MWESRQSLLLRDEAASGLSREGRPGRFEGPDALKTAQETVLELARSRTVVAEALAKIGPPPGYAAPEAWPTQRDIERAQEHIEIKPPRGVEFGKTEVVLLVVGDKDRRRAVALNKALAEGLEDRLQVVRDRRSQSLVEELSRAAELAQTNLDRATERLSRIEAKAGGDLAELRLLTESLGGESNLRMAVTAVKNDLRQAAVERKQSELLLAMLQAAQNDPLQLLAMPNDLLVTQPALQRLKDGLIDAQLARAGLQGTMTELHPLVQSAAMAEAAIRTNIHIEIAAAIRNVEVDLQLSAGRIETLEQQLAEANQRIERLAGMRAFYANMLSQVRRLDESLSKAHQDLVAAQANHVSAHASSLLTQLEEPFTPHDPSGPRRAFLVLGGLLGGLALGCGWILLTAPSARAEVAAEELVAPANQVLTRVNRATWEFVERGKGLVSTLLSQEPSIGSMP
jgi:uncharacterized protein involved in exopolysaccharide biosynthesis